MNIGINNMAVLQEAKLTHANTLEKTQVKVVLQARSGWLWVCKGEGATWSQP